MLEIIEKSNQPHNKPEYYIIFIHGVGMDANYLIPFIPELRLSKSAKFILPNAPFCSLTLKGGVIIRSWYDINSLDPAKYMVDNDGIDASVKAVDNIINSLVESGINSEKIFLAGFSQGGAISYTVALKTQHKLAGILAISTYLPYAKILNKNRFY